MTDVAVPVPQGVAGTLGEKQVFACLILGATFLTPVLIWLLVFHNPLGRQFPMVLTLIAVIGMHQASSAFFYVDKQVYRNFSHRLWMLFVVPCILIATLGTLYVCYPQGDAGRKMIDWIVGVVTLHHYQKQNLGLYCIYSSIVDPGVKVLPVERLLAMSGLVAGIMAAAYPTMAYKGPNLFLKNLFDLGYQMALPFMGICASLVVVVLLVRFFRDKSAGRIFTKSTVTKYILLAGFSAYYLPMFFFADRFIGALIAISSHAAQYYVIMFFVARWQGIEMSSCSAASGKNRASAVVYVAISVSVLILLTCLVSYATSTPVRKEFVDMVRFTAKPEELFGGMVLGLAFTHFWLDAKVWRMRHPDARAYMRKRLPFLFG